MKEKSRVYRIYIGGGKRDAVERTGVAKPKEEEEEQESCGRVFKGP